MSRAVNVPTYIADVIVSVSLLSMLVATMAAKVRIVFSRRAAHAG
jgi:simple sugar transport system permease protein